MELYDTPDQAVDVQFIYVQALNGVRLQPEEDGAVPELPEGQIANGTVSISLTPLSYSFAVISEAHASACMN